ncbi:PSD1 and planctomycete cytochrome C domain-containing protein [Armatimonas rosea]|uniref:Cytochrome c n=1 Tax=Armatimonas rosea TaxID=685828 RepID=A0A7W9SS06_ARMRO|nr:PSD1 and planctomycete cytochrome C domain-containing protein [Armatimonas rosea]MBB6051770.1 hypothetical protein [Armatimonas rosea]
MKSLALLPLVCIALAPGKAAQPPQKAPIAFRQVQPLLAKNCYACHGFDESARKANLRLDLPNRAVVGGDILASPLAQRLRRTDSLQMPPAGSGHTLTAAEKTLLMRWIGEGGKYEQHWSFVKPASASLPPSPSLRSVSRFAGTKSGLRGREGAGGRDVKPGRDARDAQSSPIDLFIRARLAKENLTPAPPADRRTLIRRVSLDLTGLPPTPERVEAFVKDTHPDAYAKLVEELLASPSYGEHWARLWLDLARYADTKGYEKDLPRTMWRWRDWVIDAFNADMPFDQFTIEQLAGDLIPNATDSQILATAFHRNTPTNDEGGTDDEEFRQIAVKDRVDTTGQVWMGLTLGCAKCHTHKYDPISQKDYYRFYAIFNQTEDADRYDDAPTKAIATEATTKRLAALKAQLAAIHADAAKPSPERTTWEAALAKQNLWSPLALKTASASSGARLATRADGAFLVSGARAEKEAYTLSLSLPAGTVTGLRLEVLKDPTLPNGGPGRNRDDQNAVVSELTVRYQDKPLLLKNARADFEQGGWPVANAIDGKEDTGWAWSPKNAEPHVAVFELAEPLVAAGGTLEVRLTQNYPNLAVGCFRLSVSGADRALLSPSLSLTAAERDEAYLKQTNPQRFAELESLQNEQARLERSIPATPIYRELPPGRQRVTRLHTRGNFLDPGEVVTPALLPSLAPPLAGAGGAPTRLHAARWLVSPENPLTARVQVNRYWARLFGVGLVETEEDFGTQGAPPSHPELLDWLALHFQRDCHWSVKKLLKTLVLSQTYQQASTTTKETLAKDPRNRLLSRGPRFRLPAEVIRDQALAAAGLLSNKLGGPSVFPPQPAGLWKVTYSGMKWETSPGEDRWRRGLYTFLRRTSPHPMLTTFDGGSGEVCLVRRIRTNTPLQALITLNDPVFVEAAGALGRRMAKQGLGVGFARLLARKPTAQEERRLRALFTETLSEFRKHPSDALALLRDAIITVQPGEDPGVLAAWTVVGNVLLNLDEALTN